MDFYEIAVKTVRGKGLEVAPKFKVIISKDLMIRGKDFYAFWDEEAGFWSQDEDRLFRIIDSQLKAQADELRETGQDVNVKYMWDDDSGSVRKWRKYLDASRDNYKPLDSKVIFANTEVKKSDYVSRRLPYPLEEGDYSAWDELVGRLYAPEERAKLEWAIGSIIAGDSKNIQKFLVLYGRPGAGKSTIIRIIEDMFLGYTATFDAKALASSTNQFAADAFSSNPLIALQHDGDLSRISDNSTLNAIVSHDTLRVNEKYKKAYSIKPRSFLIMGTNSRVLITNTQSGLIRRLIDVTPTGARFPEDYFDMLIDRINYELGAIAYHCLQTYRKMGRGYYTSYRPTRMMRSTNPVFNFVEMYYHELSAPNGISRSRAWALYKEFCEETNNKPGKMQEFTDELGTFFDEFVVRDGTRYSMFRGFRADRMMDPMLDVDKEDLMIKFEKQESILDDILADQPAQLANKDGNPRKKWESVDTTLSDINTSKLHFVKLPEHHIVIDFDLTDEEGVKSFERNLEAASGWEPTYAELSKSGQGIHLHYIYSGDVTRLANEHSPGIEIKTLLGNASLRRRLTQCNNTPIATLTSGLPTKEKKVHDVKQIQTERGLRELIARNLRKDIHPGTKPSIDFIKKILDDAYEQGLSYDVTDLRPKIVAFANNSTNRALECLKTVQQMKFQSEQPMPEAETPDDGKLVFFDVEVYPNLFVVCWKYEGSDVVVRMINPSPEDIEGLFKLKLVGFNNRRYDNHILWARYMGYDNQRLFELSNSIINSSDRNNSGLFGEAYGLSYADIYDFSSKKQGLKKFQIELKLPHRELDIPWDQPVPEELWSKVVDYCANDVLTTEAVFKARLGDYQARQILAALSGLSVNDTTQKHTAKILFGNDRAPQKKFKYTDLSEMFPGYIYDSGKSTYRGENPSEGGYVYAEPGIYENVAVLDVASMHPTSIIELDLFGREYTRKFRELVTARLAVKNREYTKARRLLDGKLEPFLSDSDDTADSLAYALKIVVNIVYGLTSAKFDNPFRDVRNKDNIVAKRGALFMIDLKHFVQDQGFQVVHIKTDSIKIPNATPEIIAAVMEFGRKYGYAFEHETTYDKFCLVNDAVYIAREGDHWEAVGAQFQHPYVYKTLFSGEKVEFDDLAETKHVTQGAIYLDLPGDDDLHFVGRTGRFVPVVAEGGGGTLYRVKDGKRYAVTGTKGYLWKEAEVVREIANNWVHIDTSYHQSLVDAAIETIQKFGSFQEFVGG